MLQSGGQNQKGPTNGKIGYITPAVWGFPTFESKGHNQQWPTNGWIGYITPAKLRVPNASKRGTQSTVAHQWADCLGGHQHFKVGDKIRRGPQMGRLAT